jgi:hypothetical protein
MDIFKAWPKIPRVENRKEFYTEKIDGTNACVVIQYIPKNTDLEQLPISYWYGDDGSCWGIWAQSRNKLITPEDDNYNFAKWVKNNVDDLKILGEGYHYGEWWGQGIQRGYDLDEKRFSLFNTKRWGEHNPNTPKCCHVVPMIEADSVEEAKKKLIDNGSLAAPGYMSVEGVVVYEYNTDSYWKAIINK